MEVDINQINLPENERYPLRFEVNTVLDAEVLLSSKIETECDLLYIDLKIISENLRLIDLNRYSWLNEFEKPVFVSLKSSKEVTFFWRVRTSDNFYSFSISGSSYEDVAAYCEKFLLSELINKRNGILKSSRNKNFLISIRDIGNSRGCDLLRMAVMRNDVDLVKSIQKFNFNVDKKDDNKCIPIDSAWSIYCNSENAIEKEKSNEIMMVLLEAGSRIPIKIKNVSKDFIYEEASADVKEFLNSKQRWHDYIEEDDLDSLKELFDKSPNYYHHCFNHNNQSLMMTAIESENDEILDFLSKHGCCIGNHETLKFREIMKKKAHWRKRQHTKRIKLDANKNHIFILEGCSIIVNNTLDFQKNWIHIQNAFEFLDKNDICSQILQLVATVNNMTIEWDFELDTVCYMLPTRSVNSVGCSEDIKNIYISGKDLLDDDKKYKVYGVIIHELCHIAVGLAYMNGSQPYQIGESNEKKKYFREVVVQQCEENRRHEKLVDIAFDEDSDDIRDAELIVRPIHIMIHNFLDPCRIQSCRNNFNILFEYFENKVLEDMKNALKVIPKLYDREEIVKYEELTTPMKVKIFHSKVQFCGIENTFQQIFKDFDKFENVLNNNDLASESIKNCLLYDQIFQFPKLNFDVKNKEPEYINRSFITHENERKVEKEENPKNDSKSINDIIENVKLSKAFILVDESGSGKTMTMKKIKLELCDDFSFIDHWITFITLKDHEDYFLKFPYQNLDIQKVLSILRTIQKLNPGIESEVFNYMFENGKIVFFFDGFDEICPHLYDFFKYFLGEIKSNKNENQIWISTRIQYRIALESILNVKAYKHESLSRTDVENLFMKTYKLHRNNEQKQIEVVIRDFNKFFEIINTDKYNQKFSNSFDLNNPLMLTIIAELYASNEIELNSKSLNVYNIFEKITAKVRKVGDSKVNVNDKDPTITNFNLGHVYQALALIYLYSDELIKDLSIIKLWKKEKLKWKIDKIQRFGFLNLDSEFDNNSSNKFIHFTHRSYAEYFVAEYIISFFTCSVTMDDEDLEIILKNVSLAFDFFNIFKFILSAMKNDTNRKIYSEGNLNKMKKLLIQVKDDLENGKNPDDYDRFELSLNFVYLTRDETKLKLLCILLLNNRQVLENFLLPKEDENFLKFVLSKCKLYFEGIRVIIEIFEIVYGSKWNKFFETKKKFKFSKNNLRYYYLDKVDKAKLVRTLKIFEFIENELNAEERFSIYKFHFGVWFSEIMSDEIVKHMMIRLNEISLEEEDIFIKIFCLFVRESDFDVVKYFKNELETILINNQSSNLKRTSKVYSYLVYKILKRINSYNEDKKQRTNIIEYLNNLDFFAYSKELQTELRKILISKKKLPISIFYNYSSEDFLKFQNLMIKVYQEKSEELALIFNYENSNRLFSNEELFNKFESFVSNFNNEKFKIRIFRAVLFLGHKFSFPLTNSLKVNPIFFNNTVNLYEKYKNTNEKVQEYLTSKNNSLRHLISELNFEIYPIAIKFIKTVFNSNETKLQEYLLKIEVSVDSIKNSENFSCLEKLINEIFENDENKIKECIKKYLFVLFKGSYNFSLIEIINSNSSEFRRLVDICLYYFKNSYEELKKIIFDNKILFSLIFNKTDETNPILIDLIKKTFESHEMSLSICFATDFDGVEQLFRSEQNIESYEQFLIEILSDEQKTKDIFQLIIFQNFNEIIHEAIKYQQLNENFIKILRKYNFSNKDFQKNINILNIFKCVNVNNYNAFKELMFEIFGENKKDFIKGINSCDSTNDFLYKFEELKLFEKFSIDFFDLDKNSITECMRKILFYDCFQDCECKFSCEHVCYYDFGILTEFMCRKHYPLIWIFFDKYAKDIENYIDLYIKYKESWSWFQELFLFSFKFDRLEILSESTYKIFINFLTKVFESDKGLLRRKIIFSYYYILENKNENIIDFCKTFNLIRLTDSIDEEMLSNNTESNDGSSENEDMPIDKNQNKLNIKQTQNNYDSEKMAELQKIADETSSDEG